MAIGVSCTIFVVNHFLFFSLYYFFFNYKYKKNISTKNKNQRIFYSINLFQKYDLIENNYEIISNGFLLDTDVLTSKNISEGFVIYEKLSI